MRALITQEMFDATIAEQEFATLVADEPIYDEISKTSKHLKLASVRLNRLFALRNITVPTKFPADLFTSKISYLLNDCDYNSANFFHYTPQEAVQRRMPVPLFIRSIVEGARRARNDIAHLNVWTEQHSRWCHDSIAKLMHLTGQEIHYILGLPLDAGNRPNLEIVLVL
jgi:hypothetical protein